MKIYADRRGMCDHFTLIFNLSMAYTYVCAVVGKDCQFFSLLQMCKGNRY